MTQRDRRLDAILDIIKSLDALPIEYEPTVATLWQALGEIEALAQEDQ